LQQVNAIVQDISVKAREVSSHYEASLDVFSSQFDKLAIDYSPEYDQYNLDEVVVGAVAPYVCVSLVFRGVCPLNSDRS
jgi:tuftelin-interacting protein 11